MDANISGRWACHVHKSSNCQMGFMGDNFYHIVPVKETTIYAQKTYNTRTENDEFWEKLPNGNYFTPIAYSSLANDYEAFKMILSIFQDLDDNYLSFNQYNKPSDFVKLHILTDGRQKIALCNKHLLKCVINKKKKQIKYTHNNWIKNIIKSLFPKAATQKNIPTNTPSWALDILNNNREKTSK